MRLEFHISPAVPTPIYRQIVDQVRHAMAAGSLRPGDALPSVRSLAEQLVINPNTVAKAYNELTRDGLIDARQGRGYFVGDRRQVFSQAERVRRLQQAIDALISEVFVLDFSPEQVIAALERKLSRVGSSSSSGRIAPGVKRGHADE